MSNKRLYCCFSIPLRNFLSDNNVKYEICALNPNSNRMMWIYIIDDNLDKLLKKWSSNNKLF